MAKITYNQKTYLSIKEIYQDEKPRATLNSFQQKVSLNIKAGMETTHAINAALKAKPPKARQKEPIKCTGCHQTKSITQFEQHQTSLTGYKSRCITCGPIKKINKPQQWASIISSKPFGNINQPVSVSI